MDQTMNEIDLAAGLDFERARARLNQVAGKAFRTYMGLRNNPAAAAADVEAARLAYEDANAAHRNFRPADLSPATSTLGGAA